MAQQRLRKSDLLLKGWEFERVYGRGKRLYGAGFILICRPNELSANRLGISVHRKIRGAVKRNRIKRIIRESFRLWREQYPANADIVFAVRPDFSLDRPQDIVAEVTPLAQKYGSFRGADANDK